MTDITTNVEAKMILHLEASRVQAINETKRKDPSIITKEKLNQAVETFFNPKPFSFSYSCVPNIKTPTNEQIMMLRFGSGIEQAKKEAQERIRKENNIDNNIKLEGL